MVVGIGDVDGAAIRGDGDAHGKAGQAAFGLLYAPFVLEVPVSVEALDAQVVGIGDVDAPIGSNGDALRVRELPVAGNGKAQAAPFAQEAPHGVEELDAVVLIIGNIDRSVWSDGNVREGARN